MSSGRRRARWLAIAGLLAACPLPAAPRRGAAEAGWKFTIAQGETAPAVVKVWNHCASAFHYRVSAPKTPFAQLGPTADRVRVEAGKTADVEVVFATAGLATGFYEGEVLVECLDCGRKRTFVEETEDWVAIRVCESPQQRFPVEMTVVPAPAPAPPPRPANEVRNIDLAMRDRMADALARLAAKRGLTVVPESLTVLSLPAGGLVAGVRVAELEKLTAAELAAGAELLFLHLDLPAPASGDAIPAGEYALSVRLPNAALLLDAQGAALRELPLAAERLPDGRTVYAAALAPELLLPVWCAGEASPAVTLWRGWPLLCLAAG
ncbi:MAG TPA: hypothetical protein VGC93_19225 [Thermoanaerobaculia bacterium]